VSNFAQALKYLDILLREMLQAEEPPDKWGIDPDQATREGRQGINEPEKAEGSGRPSGHLHAA
jgi:hypothetical protein